MLYFNNQELAAAHHVSVRTVRNWIEAARAGKIDLQLYDKGERTYIANTSKNLMVIGELAEKNKKYRPHRSQKTVMPQSKFYELYTQQQLYDLVLNLEINREIPRKYNYFGEGADNWNGYANRLGNEETPNMLKASKELLASNIGYLDYLLANYDQINVVDLGIGNALPGREFIAHLIEAGKLGRYIGIDISSRMVDIARDNVKDWFGPDVPFEGYSLDLEHDRFGYLLADEYIKSNAGKTCNVFLFLDGPIVNFKKPGATLETIHDSMGVNDFLVHTQKLDTVASRRYFDFSPGQPNGGLAPNHRYIFDLLNIDESLYEVERGFDPKASERYIRIKLKVGLTVRFMFKKGERSIYFNKGDSLLIWRARHSNVLQIADTFKSNDLVPQLLSETVDQEFVLTISRIKRETDV